MTKNFHLSFNNGEEDLLAAGKAKHGSGLSKFFKDALRADLETPQQDVDATPEDRGEHVADIIGSEFGDIFELGVRDWVFMMGGNAGTAMRNRMRTIRIKHPKEYSEVEHELRKQYPELWSLL